MNYLRTGYRTGGLLDVHLITDEDIAKRTSFALKMDAVTDPARPLAVGTAARRGAAGQDDGGERTAPPPSPRRGS
jgi:hypothetical protein